MSTDMYTPGPWTIHVLHAESGWRSFTVVAPDGIIANIDEGRIADMQANAHLIAAAPLLLEAAKLSVAECDAFSAGFCPSPVCSALGKAIDIAEGRS